MADVEKNSESNEGTAPVTEQVTEPSPPMAQPTKSKKITSIIEKTRQAKPRKTFKEPYIAIKYESDRLLQEQMDVENVMELQEAQRVTGEGGMASSGINVSKSSMLLVGRRSTIGNAPIAPAALRLHPRGFKMLSSGSPMERNMKSYFRLPAQPPRRVADEHEKLRNQIIKEVYASEQKRQNALQQSDLHSSKFGGTGTAKNVSTTVTTTIKRPNGAEESIVETLYGKQLDGFLLLENSVGATLTEENGGLPAPTSISEKYYRQRERDFRRQERDQAIYERDLRKKAKIEAKLAKLRSKKAGTGGVEDDFTFMTGTKIENPDMAEMNDTELDEFLDEEDEVEEEEPIPEEETEEIDEEDDELDLSRPPKREEGGLAPDDPSRAVEANVNDRNLIGVVPEDLAYFTSLVFVDAGENRLLVSDFSKLPAIEELHLHCNTVTQLSDLAESSAYAPVGDEGSQAPMPFANLHSLNLSFNRIPPHELAFLAHLSQLTRLDLSNNNLRTLTLDFGLSACPNLTHLALERNKFKNALHVFSCLAVMPKLVEVNLNENFFEAIPSTTEMLAYLPPVNSNEGTSAEDEIGGPSHMIFPSLEALGVANNKFQFVEDVFPVIQFPQLASIVLWGNPLVTQTKDSAILSQELIGAGIKEVVMDNPTLPKRHPQDFYSTRPPQRAEHQTKISAKGGSVKAFNGKSAQRETARNEKKSRILGTSSNQQVLHQQNETTAESLSHVQHIFSVTGSNGNVTANGPSGTFIKLPAEIHSDYQHIKGLKGQGLAQHNLPTVLPSKKKHQDKIKERAGDESMMFSYSTNRAQLGGSSAPTSARRPRVAKPTAGTFASFAGGTASAAARSNVTRDEIVDLRTKKADEERWLPPINQGQGSSYVDTKGTERQPFYLGGGGGGVTDGSTTQQALSELRRLLAKK